VLRAAKEHGKHRVVALFQPHRYSRTRDLMAEFGEAFADADLVYVTSIYAAGEDPLEGVDAGGIVAAIRGSGHPACRLVPDAADLPEAVRADLRGGDVVITLGAGNIHQAGEALLGQLASRGAGAATP
jgi:UDP-N-acetylmuramate--alanine ligase